jgi:hypothetical protein
MVGVIAEKRRAFYSDIRDWMYGTSGGYSQIQGDIEYYGYPIRAVEEENAVVLPSGEQASEVRFVLVKTEADAKAYQAGNQSVRHRLVRFVYFGRDSRQGTIWWRVFISNRNRSAEQEAEIAVIYQGIQPYR